MSFAQTIFYVIEKVFHPYIYLYWYALALLVSVLTVDLIFITKHYYEMKNGK